VDVVDHEDDRRHGASKFVQGPVQHRWSVELGRWRERVRRAARIDRPPDRLEHRQPEPLGVGLLAAYDHRRNASRARGVRLPGAQENALAASGGRRDDGHLPIDRTIERLDELVAADDRRPDLLVAGSHRADHRGLGAIPVNMGGSVGRAASASAY
jgi:hypothetical protein